MTPADLEKLNRRLERMESKVDKVRELQITHTSHLAEHMRRTEIAESRLELLQHEISPIKQHVAVVGAIVKAIAFVGTLVGIATGAAKLAGW